MKKISIITLISATTLFLLSANIQAAHNPYGWQNPIKRMKHAHYMDTLGSQEAPIKDQDAIKKALTEMGTDTSLPIYNSNYSSNHNGCTVTKTGIWLDKNKGGEMAWGWDNRQHFIKNNKTYRHYYAAAHVKNGTKTQHAEDQQESNIKALGYGMLFGPSMYFLGESSLKHAMKKGLSGIKLAPRYALTYAGLGLCFPTSMIISGSILRIPVLDKRKKIEKNARELAIETIKKNHDDRTANRATGNAPYF